MSLLLSWLLYAAGAYLLGSVPTGLLVSRARGVDIRTVGSCSIGATNVFRSVSKTAGVLTFICDVMKGFVPSIAPLLATSAFDRELRYAMATTAGVMAIVGHNWPVYLKFKGGKGIATSAGFLIAIAPKAFGLGIVSWTAIFMITGYVSVASIVAAIAVSASAWPLYLEHGWVAPATLSILGGIAVLRHRNNIGRLIKGAEHRFPLPWLKKTAEIAGSSPEKS